MSVPNGSLFIVLGTRTGERAAIPQGAPKSRQPRPRELAEPLLRTLIGTVSKVMSGRELRVLTRSLERGTSPSRAATVELPRIFFSFGWHLELCRCSHGVHGLRKSQTVEGTRVLMASPLGHAHTQVIRHGTCVTQGRHHERPARKTRCHCPARKLAAVSGSARAGARDDTNDRDQGAVVAGRRYFSRSNGR